MRKIPQEHIDSYVRFFTILAKIDRRLKLEEKERKKKKLCTK